MNKLGFYVEDTTVRFLRDALRQARPPVMLLHAGDRGLLQEIRRELSPDTFIIGRMFLTIPQQHAALDAADPEASGRALADTIINYDYGFSKELGANGRRLVDAWMSLNESIAGPASFGSAPPDTETRRRYEAYDRLQVGFHKRLREEGLEAVAFNFAAGNFTQPAHYLDWFPRTLETYTYLGFHEYGWPTLMPKAGTETGALLYRPCMEQIRARYGPRHKVIITEAGLARMYKHQQGGDVGWLYPGETLSEEHYWDSLQWYNAQLNQDDYVLGCCLFSVGHGGRWETFRHLGVDNAQRPILLMNQIQALREGTPPAPTPTPEPAPVPTPPTPDDAAALLARVAVVKKALLATIDQANEFAAQLGPVRDAVDALARAADPAPRPAAVQALLQRLAALASTLDRLGSSQAEALDIPALKAQVAGLQGEAQALLPAAQAAAEVAPGLASLRTALADLTARAGDVAAAKHQAQALLAQATQLELDLGASPKPVEPTPVGQPALQDKRAALPTRSGAAYPTRSQRAIKRIVVHHTVTRDDVTPERVAEAQIAKGKPGITYHFLVNGNGAITWTQPFETVVEQTLRAEVNADSLAVALAGNFQAATPSDAQLAAAAALIAWLLNTFQLPSVAVFGRMELDPRVSSPGAQWLQGARFKDTLLGQVAAQLNGQG